MTGPIPVIALFAVMRLPRAPWEALMVLGMQAVAVVAAALPVFLLNW